MSSGWISVMGLYYMDQSIFDDMILPDGMDADLVRDNILFETAELEIILTNPEKLKWAISTWSKKKLPSWQRIYNVLLAKYDPLENYRRHEQRNIDREKTGQNEDHTTIGTENAGSGSDVYIPDETSTLSKTGFNSGALQVTEQENRTGENTTTTSYENQTDTTNDRTGSDQEQESTEETALLYGNIGVTTSQQMLIQEIEVAQQNIIEIITEDFKESFCVMVY